MKKIIKIIPLIILAVGILPAQEKNPGKIITNRDQKLFIPSNMPLGMAFDGRVLWVSDIKEKRITGYDFEVRKITYSNLVKVPGLRDIAFWKVYLISPFQKHLWIIDPITGNIVEKIHIKELKDPTSIAANGDMLYIYDRGYNRFFRYSMSSRRIVGSFPLQIIPEDDDTLYLRGATWFGNAIWVTEKNNHLFKINPDNGEKLSFLPIPDKTFSVEFIDGQLFSASPDTVETLDFTETEYYISSKRNDFRVHLDYTISPPWLEGQQKNEKTLDICFNSMRMNPQQNYTGYKNDGVSLKIKRYHGGELRFCGNFKDNLKKQNGHFSTAITLRATVYILNSNTIEQYFNAHDLPAYPRFFTRLEDFKPEMINRMEEKKKLWKEEHDGKHPYLAIPFLQSQNITDLQERIIFFRLLEIPAREAVFYHIKEKSQKGFLQLYFHPVGWVTVTDLYRERYPKEFPISEFHLEFYYPETLTVFPDVIAKDEKGKMNKVVLTREDKANILKWINIQLQAND